ncbi:MAG: hypothetical protein AXW17_03175 [Colwellia sp. Phe_37]|nr:MAG: hypothetical protein AXW17_03175 [Colwellia sp. Phe_37]
MIFNDKYSGDKNEIFDKLKFKEFNLPDDANYTTHSLELIYPMYCYWLNTRYGIYVVKFNLSIPDEPGSFCSEYLIDHLFHRVQGDVGYRNSGSDKSIGLLWKTYRKESSTIHEGCFLVPMTEVELTESPRGDEAHTPEGVTSIFSRIIDKYNFNEEVGILQDEAMELKFIHPKQGEGSAVIFNDSRFELHEQGFVTLCEVAQLPKDKPDADTGLFRARCGYNPTRSYVSGDWYDPF